MPVTRLYVEGEVVSHIDADLGVVKDLSSDAPMPGNKEYEFYLPGAQLDFPIGERVTFLRIFIDTPGTKKVIVEEIEKKHH
jgi:hypothetical protein